MIRLTTYILIVFMPVFSALHARAQAQRDPAAVTLLTNVLNVMGGAAAMATMMDATATGTVTPKPGSHLKPGKLVLKDAPPEFSSEIQTDTSSSIFTSGNGKPDRKSVV